jgi:hypothetical protein
MTTKNTGMSLIFSGSGTLTETVLLDNNVPCRCSSIFYSPTSYVPTERGLEPNEAIIASEYQAIRGGQATVYDFFRDMSKVESSSSRAQLCPQEILILPQNNRGPLPVAGVLTTLVRTFPYSVMTMTLDWKEWVYDREREELSDSHYKRPERSIRPSGALTATITSPTTGATYDVRNGGTASFAVATPDVFITFHNETSQTVRLGQYVLTLK